VTFIEGHDDALACMIEQIDACLAFRVAKVPALEGVDFALALERTALAAQGCATASPAAPSWLPRSHAPRRGRFAPFIQPRTLLPMELSGRSGSWGGPGAARRW
jgi:hypothetical protein